MNDELLKLRSRLIEAMKRVFGEDQRRIDHALKVLDYAQQINQQEEACGKIVIAAAVLHDIGIHKAEKKYGSSAGKYQEIEGPPIARDILEKLDFETAEIDHICKIVANHHSAKDIDTPEFRIIWDADWLVNIPDEFPNADSTKLSEVIQKVFKTQAGKKLAEEIYL